MRVGISVMTHAGQSVWENGINQNVIFLARLLRCSPAVSEVILLDSGDQGALPADAESIAGGLRIMKPHDATLLIDVVIEMAGGLDVEWLDYMRALGAKVVFHCCGQPYVALIESTIFGTGGYVARADRCDEIWILPKDRAFIPMLESMHRCPVFEVPYLWEPCFLEARINALKSFGLSFGYTRKPLAGTARAMRFATFEPNISVVKCCVIPMLLADYAYRQDPESVAQLHVLNSVQMKDHLTFVHLAGSLDLYKAGRMVFEQRHDFAGYVSQHADAVISHQYDNMQNLLYFDALHGGYPLVHNSPWLAGVGYFYPDQDVEAAARALLEAVRHHDEDLDRYRRTASEFMATLDPHRPCNVKAYVERLHTLLLPSLRKDATADARCA
jgi:hypothetical protein